jgi:hypothetical protein
MLRDLFGRLRGRGDADADLDARNPREAIRLQYRRFQLFMARAGLPRGAEETPLEYSAELARILPAAHDDLLDIANAYDQARYSEPQSPVPPAGNVEQAVDRVRGVLVTLPDLPSKGAS